MRNKNRERMKSVSRNISESFLFIKVTSKLLSTNNSFIENLKEFKSSGCVNSISKDILLQSENSYYPIQESLVYYICKNLQLSEQNVDELIERDDIYNKGKFLNSLFYEFDPVFKQISQESSCFNFANKIQVSTECIHQKNNIIFNDKNKKRIIGIFDQDIERFFINDKLLSEKNQDPIKAIEISPLFELMNKITTKKQIDCLIKNPLFFEQENNVSKLTPFEYLFLYLLTKSAGDDFVINRKKCTHSEKHYVYQQDQQIEHCVYQYFKKHKQDSIKISLQEISPFVKNYIRQNSDKSIKNSSSTITKDNYIDILKYLIEKTPRLDVFVSRIKYGDTLLDYLMKSRDNLLINTFQNKSFITKIVFNNINNTKRNPNNYHEFDIRSIVYKIIKGMEVPSNLILDAID